MAFDLVLRRLAARHCKHGLHALAAFGRRASDRDGDDDAADEDGADDRAVRFVVLHQRPQERDDPGRRHDGDVSNHRRQGAGRFRRFGEGREQDEFADLHDQDF